MSSVDVATFLAYLESVHTRTARVAGCITPDDLEWCPAPTRWSCGDIIRHLAGIERWLYAETVLARPYAYPGHEQTLAEGHEATMAYYERLHRDARSMFASLDAAQLEQKVITSMGTPITTWKWLRAMVEHEVHHREKLYLMLALRGVATPPLFGLTSEQVREGAYRS